jgi:hypothetical protein
MVGFGVREDIKLLNNTARTCMDVPHNVAVYATHNSVATTFQIETMQCNAAVHLTTQRPSRVKICVMIQVLQVNQRYVVVMSRLSGYR